MFLHKLKLGIVALMLVLGTGAAVVAYQGAQGPAEGPKVAQPVADPAPQKTATIASKGEYAKPVAEWSILTDQNPGNAAIFKKLSQPIAMKFATETPLEDIIKYIHDATQDETAGLPIGIPIYVNPQGLQDSDISMASTVQIDLEGIPLKTTLRLLLEQIQLTYEVRDGLLIITSTQSEDVPTPYNRLDEMDRRGELTKDQYKELMELLKLRMEFLKLRKELNKVEYGTQ